MHDRIAQWLTALEATDAEAIPAVDLYSGSFWSIVRELPTVAQKRGLRTTLLVASAGYGLVGDLAALKPCRLHSRLARTRSLLGPEQASHGTSCTIGGRAYRSGAAR